MPRFELRTPIVWRHEALIPEDVLEYAGPDDPYLEYEATVTVRWVTPEDWTIDSVTIGGHALSEEQVPDGWTQDLYDSEWVQELVEQDIIDYQADLADAMYDAMREDYRHTP